MSFKTETQNSIYTPPNAQAVEFQGEEDDIDRQKAEQAKTAVDRAMKSAPAKPCKVSGCKCQNFVQVPGVPTCNQTGCNHLETEHG